MPPSHRYEDEEGFYYGLRKAVIISLTDGSEHQIDVLLSESMQLWTKELVERGIIPNAPKLSELEPIARTREQLSKVSKMRILGQKAEYLEIQQKMLIFRFDLNVLNPVLPGEPFHHKCDVELTILPSPIEV